MAEIKVKGLDEYSLMLSRLAGDSEAITKEAVYAGAKVVADAIAEEIKALPISEGYGSPEKPINGVTARQKEDLLKGFGLAKMKNEGGFLHTKAGFDGYGSLPTKKYPKGVPNALIARSVESGTSFRKKNPFIRRAVNKVKKKAQDAMGEKIEEEIQRLALKEGK